jgi:predicted phosphate transport protein (TIGR00153 family)
MSRLTPKEDKFYDLFISSAHIIYEASVMLRDLIKNLDNAEAKVKEIEEMEHKGDKQVHDILEQLNKTFITPIDREDIYAIAKQLDDILDAIEATAHRFIMFNIKTSEKDAIKLSEMIVNSCKEVINLMEELKNMKKSKKLSEKIIEINRIEDDGDKIFRTAITSLFNGQTPTLEVIKWREIYDFIEQTLDACEEVANTVEGVVMKHA